MSVSGIVKTRASVRKASSSSSSSSMVTMSKIEIDPIEVAETKIRKRGGSTQVTFRQVSPVSSGHIVGSSSLKKF